MAKVIITRAELLASAKVQESFLNSIAVCPISDKTKVEKAMAIIGNKDFLAAEIEDAIKKMAADQTAMTVGYNPETDEVWFSANPEFVIESLENMDQFVKGYVALVNAAMATVLAMKSEFDLFKPAMAKFAKKQNKITKKWSVKKAENYFSA